ncbi:MAG: NAD(P)/FAD-dependent oxidoreductase [Myxococcota bacterium]|nr:NAD(P)/FAD-dependent oxidoreductase [Myxococcota bacterium]
MSHFDVVIVGAGLSGIGTAYHLQANCPGKTYAILEGRDAVGGTWDLYRYPGVRSDSDMHTLGYSFKPWRAEKAIADGPSILDYINETADENAIRKNIHFNSPLQKASWSSAEARWTLKIRVAEGEASREPITCNMLLMCSGYYSYDEGYWPEFEGQESFEGEIFHPQFWPEDLDYAGKRVVVIGSGATAMTVVPAIASDVAHVTMLQRSPTYVVSRPAKDAVANFLRRILPEKWAYAITRFKNVQLQRFMYQRTRTRPERIKEILLREVRKHLGPDYDVDRHFTPSYNPWDQRLCLVPDGDLFEAINSGNASVVTDQIECITKKGIRVSSGEELDADMIVVATGLELKVMGGVEFTADGEAVSFADHLSYKGMLYSDLPNLVQTFGYINASWTLRADLTAEYACRLINRMDELGQRQCTPRLREEDQAMDRRPWIVDFDAGYMQRRMHLMPKQGDRAPWLNTQDFAADKKMVRHAPLEDGVLTFSNPSQD